MILGKRTATDALLPTIDVRPYKRTSSSSSQDDEEDDSLMSDSSNKSNWKSWLYEASSSAVQSFLALRQQPEAQEIVANASKQIHQTLDSASTSIKEVMDNVLPPSLVSKPPVPGGPSTPIRVLDSPAPSPVPSLLAPPLTPNGYSIPPSPFSPQKSWAPSPPSSIFKVPISPIRKDDGTLPNGNGWLTSSPIRPPAKSLPESPTPGPSGLNHSAYKYQSEAELSRRAEESYRSESQNLFASTSTNRTGWSYASSSGGGGLLSRSQGLGVKASPRYEHIHMRQHKEKLAARSRKQLEELARRYDEKKAAGYAQDFQTFVDFEDYRARVQQMQEQAILGSGTTRKLESLRTYPGGPALPAGSSISPRTRKVSFESTATTSSPPRSRMLAQNGLFSGSVRTGVDLTGIGSARRLSTSTSSHTLFPKAGDLPWPSSLKTPPGPPALDTSWKTKATRGLDLGKAIEKAKAALEAPRPPLPDVPAFERLTVKDRKADEEITKRLRQERRKKLPTRLTDSQKALVQRYLRDPSFIAKVGREQVTSKDIGRLGPGSWLNDEIINFWGGMLMDRAERAKAEANNPATTGGVGGGKGKGKAVESDLEEPGRFGHPPPLHDIHFFNTFFYPKIEQGYAESRVGRWTKKIDIFSKDVVLIPINQGNAHWSCAAINFKKKRFECYDSMSGPLWPSHQFHNLRDYVDKEHMDKKKKPFDFTGWVDCSDKEMPQQQNGYDCGVFVCMVLEALSRGEEAEDFVFDQHSMPYIRQRIVWEIGRQKLS